MPREAYYLPERKLVSQDDAALIERARVPRSKFSGSWNRKASYNAGLLYPILIDEILPGDHVRYSLTSYIRMATPLFPIFDSQRIDTHWFYVPSRILWTNWVKMMGEQDDPGDSIAFTVPQVQCTVGGDAVGSLVDHFGLPVLGQVGGADNIIVNALPFRAYNRIWNDWFRDENLLPKIPNNTGNGPDVIADYTLMERAKSHDYFTSALPWPQKFTAPTVPFSGLAPIVGLGASTTTHQSGGVAARETDGINANYAEWKDASDLTHGIVMDWNAVTDYPKVYANLAAATGVAINTFRQAFLVQQLLERDARGGTRYVELLRSHFGVVSPDFRLQRPEYIGGGQSPLNITPIAQTTPTATEPLGALGAAGTATGQHSASYAATEHGYIIALLSVRTQLSYQQGVHKLWDRETRYDFYWPSLAGLGEQAITRREIYATGNAGNDNTVFGYQERWHEYRTKTSDVVGIMRSTAANTIDMWHLAQLFGAAPTLGGTFIRDTAPMTRILAAGAQANGQQYLADIHYQRQITRPIPMYGTPVLLGRF